MRIYELVKMILEQKPITRTSDKRLIWYVMMKKNNNFTNSMTFVQFMEIPSFESITRARRKIQELYPELRSPSQVAKWRKEKEATKGTFIYREEI